MELINKSDILADLISKKDILRFSLLVGPVGSGRKTLLKQLAKELKWLYLPFEGRVETIRTIIETAHTVLTEMLICIEDGNDLTIAAQNALLKLGEEPPRNMHIFICVDAPEVLLPTIRTRASVYLMPDIEKRHLHEYLNLTLTKEITDVEFQSIISMSQTYSDVDDLLELEDITDFFEFTKKVVYNIHTVSTTNAFRILNNLSLKVEKIGFKPFLFLKGLKYQLTEIMYCGGNLGVILGGIRIINHYTQLLQMSLNVQMVMFQFIKQFRTYIKLNGGFKWN